MIEFIMPLIVPGIIVIAVLIVITCGYVKAPPDQAYIKIGRAHF